MKKYIAIILVLAACLSLCACGSNNDIDEIINNINGEQNVVVPSVTTPETEPKKEEMAPAFSHKHRELRIKLNSTYHVQNQGEYISDTDMITIYCVPYDMEYIRGTYNLDASAELYEIAHTFLEDTDPEQTFFEHYDEYCYGVKEVEYDDGSVWSVASAIFVSEEHLWEIRFVMEDRRWDSGEDRFFDIVNTIYFDYE